MPVTVVARRYGVARQTVHEWLRRYANDGGLGGLADRSSRPDSCPHQMSVVTEARIVGMRREHPGWGPEAAGHLRRGVAGGDDSIVDRARWLVIRPRTSASGIAALAQSIGMTASLM